MTAGRRFTVGRATDADVPIADDSVSRTHAEVQLLENDRLRVKDLGSQNGTVLIRQGREFPVKDEQTAFLSDLLKFGEVTIAARDLIDLLKEAAAPVAAGARAAAPQPAAAVLIRCDCGAIKTRGARCPACGE
ncbi:MAG: FHA domain-containing protein [Candidatus Binataceae bacterium]